MIKFKKAWMLDRVREGILSILLEQMVNNQTSGKGVQRRRKLLYKD